mgnify:FL=1
MVPVDIMLTKHSYVIKNIISKYHKDWVHLGSGRHGIVFRMTPGFIIKFLIPEHKLLSLNSFRSETLGFKSLKEINTSLAPIFYGSGKILEGYDFIIREELFDVPLSFLDYYFLDILTPFHRLIEGIDSEETEIRVALKNASGAIPEPLMTHFETVVDIFLKLRDRGILISDLCPQNLGLDKQGCLKIRDASSFLIDDIAFHATFPRECPVNISEIGKFCCLK